MSMRNPLSILLIAFLALQLVPAIVIFRMALSGEYEKFMAADYG